MLGNQTGTCCASQSLVEAAALTDESSSSAEAWLPFLALEEDVALNEAQHNFYYYDFVAPLYILVYTL